jgi:hypothetical protein
MNSAAQATLHALIAPVARRGWHGSTDGGGVLTQH